MLRFWVYSLLFLYSCIGSGQNLRSGGELKPEQANMDIQFYSIVLDVDFEKKYITGHTDVVFNLLETSNGVILDFWNGLNVSQVQVSDIDIPYEHTSDDVLEIGVGTTFPAGSYSVRVYYHGHPGIAENPPWQGGFQWEKDSKGNHWMAITCQGEGGKIFFPCKDHPSDKPDMGAELIITVPEGLVVAGPGLLKGVSKKDGKSTWHWKTNYPISNYSLVFNVGKYDLVSRDYTTIDGNRVPMQFYVLEENIDKAQAHLDLLERSLRVLEKYFGEYPFVDEKVGVVETPHLGMEHQTMNAYGNKFRYQKVGDVDFDWLMHHELGHEWWGNKVFNKDWAHMWIQEGICSFGDALFRLEYGGEEDYKRHMRNTALNVRNRQPIVPGEVADSDEVYQPDIYGKGAFFMHSLKYVLGDKEFDRIILEFIQSPEFTYINPVVTDDVEQFFSEKSGRDLSPLFDFYLHTTQWLEIEIKLITDKTYNVRIRNYEDFLPMEFETSGGTIKTELGDQWIEIISTSMPVPDPEGYYLKKVIRS